MFASKDRRSLPPHQLESVAKATFLPRRQLTDSFHVIRIFKYLVDIITFHRAVVDAIHSFENLQGSRFVTLEDFFAQSSASRKLKSN